MFATTRKPVCNFPVSNTNLYLISRRFPDIADYWSNFRCQAMPLFIAFVRVTPVCRISKFGPQETIDIVHSFCDVVQNILRYIKPFRRNSRQRKVDRSRDGRTDILVANAALNYVARPKRCKVMLNWTGTNITVQWVQRIRGWMGGLAMNQEAVCGSQDVEQLSAVQKWRSVPSVHMSKIFFDLRADKSHFLQVTPIIQRKSTVLRTTIIITAATRVLNCWFSMITAPICWRWCTSLLRSLHPESSSRRACRQVHGWTCRFWRELRRILDDVLAMNPSIASPQSRTCDTYDVSVTRMRLSGYVQRQNLLK